MKSRLHVVIKFLYIILSNNYSCISAIFSQKAFILGVTNNGSIISVKCGKCVFRRGSITIIQQNIIIICIRFLKRTKLFKDFCTKVSTLHTSNETFILISNNFLSHTAIFDPLGRPSEAIVARLREMRAHNSEYVYVVLVSDKAGSCP